MITLQMKGIEEASAYLKKLRGNLERLGKARIMIGSNLKYAYGIEFGRHRVSGRTARKMGGAFMLTNARKEVQADLIQEVKAAIVQGGDIDQALYRAALKAENIAKSNTPVKTGSLRRSLHTIRG